MLELAMATFYTYNIPSVRRKQSKHFRDLHRFIISSKVNLVLWGFAWKSALKIDTQSRKTTAYVCTLASAMRNPKEPLIWQAIEMRIK